MSKNKNARQQCESNGAEMQAAQRARRKQLIVGVAIGLVVGVVLSAIAQFWLWAPAGIVMGLATGAIMKPPSE
jgi:predicted MFS family arabinose efflux permease